MTPSTFVGMLRRMNRVARSLPTIMATLGLAPPGARRLGRRRRLLADRWRPRAARPGTEFVFKGQGFTPTTLTLTRGDEAPQVGGREWPDRVPRSVQPRRGATRMSGKWRAVAAGCADAASIRVTLPPTATEASATTTTPAPDDTAQLAGLTLLGVLFLGATALLLPRLTRAARAG